MTVHLAYEPEGGHVRVRVAGDPSLGEFLEMLRRVGRDSSGWSERCVLLDLREVTPLYSFTEQFTMGEEVARSLAHLGKLASLVPEGRVTRVSEKAASHRGANVRVFSDEAEARAWLAR